MVDNNSTDGTVEAVREFAKACPIPVRVIRNIENLGFGKGHNNAAHESQGEYLLLLNTDTIMLNDALATFISSFMALNPPSSDRYKSLINRDAGDYRVHFAGPKLLNANLTPQPSCGPYYSIPVIVGALFMKGDHWGLTRYSPVRPQRVDWVSGACILTKKHDFLETGGFDENIFMYMEEIDLLHTASKKGMQIWCLPQAHVVHLGSASSNKTYPIFQVYRGFLYLYKKHHSSLELRMVQWLLCGKAYAAIVAGRLLRRPNLIETYQKALRIVRDSYMGDEGLTTHT